MTLFGNYYFKFKLCTCRYLISCINNNTIYNTNGNISLSGFIIVYSLLLRVALQSDSVDWYSNSLKGGESEAVEWNTP